MIDVTKVTWAIVNPRLVWPGKPRGPLFDSMERAIAQSTDWIARYGWAGHGGDIVGVRCPSWWCAVDVRNLNLDLLNE
jgi:hypothetical protein